MLALHVVQCNIFVFDRT